MKKRRTDSAFSLSFLDVMCCGFGAVVLLVMLLNGQTLQKRAETHKDLQAELDRITLLKEFADAHLAEQRNEVETIEREDSDSRMQAKQLRTEISKKQQENSSADQTARQQRKEIAQLKKKKASLEKSIKKQKGQESQPISGRKLVGFDGEKKRQYLTGLKLGGERTLILVDASASMLDETIVNVVRRKLMNVSKRRQAPKWQRSVRTLKWLLANLQPNKKFQVYYFNTKAKPAMSTTKNQWLSANAPANLKGVMSAIGKLAPQGGTNLHEAFNVIDAMRPRPDSVILLTDGLPTQGKGRTVSGSITGKERLGLFNSAVRGLPKGVPINTLLFPIEGDPAAAAAFWGLAISTRGSFITPSRDWP